MNVGIATSHLYSMGGGYQAVKWHILALRKLGHGVTVYTRNMPSEYILRNWFDGVPLRQYIPHCEKNHDLFINIDHFAQAFPEAKDNIAHVFFPMDSTPPPYEGTRLYSNSAYTARYVQDRWGVSATPLYIPIDNHFHTGRKEKIVLHVSRFSEPSDWADKGQEQMIQAWRMMSKNIPGWKLVLAGSVDPRQESYFSKLIRLGSGYEIDLMPNLSPETLASLFSRASIYWHATGMGRSSIPSAQEHMGITPLEAQASGCVVIAYNSGGIPEVVQANKTGLLFDNAMDLPHLTMNLLNDMYSWSQMSEAAQVWTTQWRDFDAFVKRVDDMINNRPIMPFRPLVLDLKNRPSDVTAVIPTYNSPLLEQCLASLHETAHDMKVLVINNGEQLSNLTLDHNVRVHEAGTNLGFAGAHRLAAGMVDTPFVLMLNDDVIATHDNWLEQLLFVMNADKVGVVGPKLLFPDGRLQFAGGIVDWNRPDIGYHRAYGQVDGVEYSTAETMDFITGAALLCRTHLYQMPDELLQGFNYEDTWLCSTARSNGYQVVYQPASVMTHYEGETKARSPEMTDKVNLNREAFVKRWSGVGLRTG